MRRFVWALLPIAMAACTAKQPDKSAQARPVAHASPVAASFGTEPPVALTETAFAPEVNPPGPVLTVSRNVAGEVVASVSGLIARCGVTATNMPPTFRISGTSIIVMQDVAGVMCMRDVPPDAKKPYKSTLSFGRLKEGTYTISWSFPRLKSTYKVIGKPASSDKP